MMDVLKRMSVAKDTTLFVVFFGLAMAVLLVAKVSLIPELPFVQTDNVVMVKHQSNDEIILMNVRKMKGFYKVSVNSTEELYERSNPSNRIKVHGAAFESEQSKSFTVVTTIHLPITVKGTWCSHVVYAWWPALSQREFNLAVPEVCFDTTEYD